MVPMKMIDRRFRIETPAFDGLFKEVQGSQRERSDGSWDYGLTFIFPRPPLITVKRPAQLRANSEGGCHRCTGLPDTGTCGYSSSELALKIL
jgi:hypothetical protein